MSSTVAHPSCYLVEWYHPELGAEPLEHTDAALDECAAAMSADKDLSAVIEMLRGS